MLLSCQSTHLYDKYKFTTFYVIRFDSAYNNKVHGAREAELLYPSKKNGQTCLGNITQVYTVRTSGGLHTHAYCALLVR
jgi:hypothetical protein